jgi:hypothetical protein
LHQIWSNSSFNVTLENHTNLFFVCIFSYKKMEPSIIFMPS